MRTAQLSGVIINYPNALCFCASPMIISFSGSNLISTKLSIMEWQEGDEGAVSLPTLNREHYIDERDAFCGKVTHDISDIISQLFREEDLIQLDYSTKVNPDNLSKKITIQGSITTNGGVYSFRFTTIAVWGALDPDEEYSSNRYLTIFPAYPYTLTIASNDNSYCDIQADSFHVATDHSVKAGINTYNVHAFVKEWPVNELVLSFPFTQKVKNDELTTVCRSFRFMIDNRSDGIYLRWINRHGEWCYWLFKKGGSQIAASTNTTFERSDTADMAYKDGVTTRGTQRRNKNLKEIVTLCAPLCTSDEFDYLEDIMCSPVVDLFSGTIENPLWKRINVVDGSATRSTKKLQDFMLNIELPTKNIQCL